MLTSVDKFFGGAFVLIGLYLVLTANQSGAVIGSITGGTSDIFRTLQGR